MKIKKIKSNIVYELILLHIIGIQMGFQLVVCNKRLTRKGNDRTLRRSAYIKTSIQRLYSELFERTVKLSRILKCIF